MKNPLRRSRRIAPAEALVEAHEYTVYDIPAVDVDALVEAKVADALIAQRGEQLRATARNRGQTLELLREFDNLTLHAPNVKPPEGVAWAFGPYYGPSIFETPHDAWLHDEGKPCPHCRAISIVAEIRALVESGA